ncbi:hypothetical protein ACWC0C_17005 [Streptomyces sp. NPDC001709]
MRRTPDAVTERLAEVSGRAREEPATAVRAWHAGGVAALAVLDADWQVEGVARARAALEAAWEADERPPFTAAGIGGTSRMRGSSCASAGTGAGGRIATMPAAGSPRAGRARIRRRH